MPLKTYIVIINNLHNIFKNIQLSHLGCSGLISIHKDTFWDNIIHQIRYQLISFFIVVTWIVFQTGEGEIGVEIYIKHYSSSHDEETFEAMRGRGALPYLKMVGNFHSIDPHFWHFPITLGPTRSYWPPLSAENICLSLSWLVHEIIRPKVYITLQQNLQKLPFEF